MPEPNEIQAVQAVTQILMQTGQESGKRVIEYLTIANGSGAIACVAFMGSGATFHDSLMIRALLVVFMIGVLLVGAMIVRDVEYMRKTFWAFTDKAIEFQRGEATFAEAMGSIDRARAKDHARTNRALGLWSLLSFGIGALVTCIWLVVSASCNLK